MANSIDIDKVDRKHLLKALLDYKEFNHFMGVGRKLHHGKKTFIWKIFKIITKDGVPDIAVLETLENDRNVIPETALLPSTPTYDFLNVTSKPYDIFIEEYGKPQQYLAVSDDMELVFQKPGKSSKFYRYNYKDPHMPARGALVAFSLNRISPEDIDVGSDSDSSYRQTDDATTSPATGDDKKTATVKVFPKKMIGTNIPPDHRFWFVLATPKGMSMRSMVAPGMYLGFNSKNKKAILSTTETLLNIRLTE